MSKVKTNLLKINLAAGNFKLACHLALQLNSENGRVHTETAFDDVKHVINKNQWAGYLAALKSDGVYFGNSEGWGSIK